MIYSTRAVFDIETGALIERDRMEAPAAWLCDRAVQSEAQGGQATAASTAGQLGTTASGVGSTVIPGYTKMATDPQGFGPAGLATMETAAQSTAGGAASGARGALEERAARLRNPAGTNADIASANQGAARASGSAVQDILASNEQLKTQQQDAGLKGLSGIYGADTDAMLKSMGIQNEDENTQLQAGKEGWLQNLEGGLGALGSLAGGAGSLIKGLKA